MAVVYLATPGTTVHRRGEHLEVRSEQAKVADLRLHEVERIVVIGSVQLTTQAIALLLNRGTDVSFLSGRGRPLGALVSHQSRNVYLRLAQFDRWKDGEFRLAVGRKLVEAKLTNQARLLQRHVRNHPASMAPALVTRITDLVPRLATAEAADELMGFEGAGSAAYFEGFATMSRRVPFTGRKRRPPPDPVNAVLSLGYVLLTNELAGLVEAAGFDPYIGYLHGIRYGRQSLPLDLVEPFRPCIIDRLTLRLFNLAQLVPDDFEGSEEKGFRLHAEKFKQYLFAYESFLTQPAEGADSPTWRELLRRHVGAFREAVMSKGELACYTWPG